MDSEPKSRRGVLKVLGTGAAVSTAGVYGLSHFSQPASAEVAMSFGDAEVELPEDKTIEDLRLVGKVTGHYNTGGKSMEGVALNLDVQFGTFGSFEDRKHSGPSDEKEGTISWETSHSLVEKTSFDPETHVEHIGRETNSVSWNATVEASITLFGGETAEVLVDKQTGDTATITFYEPTDDTEAPDDGSGGDGTDTETPSASVEITFGFEVDK